nr:LysR family transcriptional regulator [uncultured Tolumonas sp.]
MLPKSTLEQWFILQTVIEKDGFAQAAQVLNRSQSSVSYALHTLQERLGVPLLRMTGRKATLTESGQVMLAQAKPLIDAFLQLESRAQSLRQGIKPTLNLVVDVVFPKEFLFKALRLFQDKFPETRVHLTEIIRTESEKQLTERDADLYITPLPAGLAISGQFLLNVDFIAVAQQTHALHASTQQLSTAQLSCYPLISIADQQSQRLEKKKITANSDWTFTTIEAAVAAIQHGVGYGWLPLHYIQPLLERGELIPIHVEQQIRPTSLYMVWGDDQQFDKTVSEFAAILQGTIHGA